MLNHYFLIYSCVFIVVIKVISSFVNFDIDSYEHRAGVRAKLASDDNWISQYFGKILPWFQKQDNMTLKTLPNFDDVIYPKSQGMLQQCICKQLIVNNIKVKM